MLTKKEKEEVVKNLTKKINESKGIFLTNIVGLDSEETLKMRKQLTEVNASIVVSRNTLIQRAAQGTACESFLKDLQGANALAFSKDDATAVAKILSNFGKIFNFVTLEKGFVEGQIVESSKLQMIAQLPSRNEMLGLLLATMMAPVSALARILHSISVQKQGE